MKGNAGDTIVKKIDLSPELVRVALYIRVSGEEQKIKGLSLEAQQERRKHTQGNVAGSLLEFTLTLPRPPERTFIKEPTFNA